MRTILFYIIIFSLHSTDFTVHTFKKGNLRLALSPSWKIKKESSIQKENFLAFNKEESIHLKIESIKQTKENLKTKFIQVLKSKNYEILNISELRKEVEYTFYSLDGYIAAIHSKKEKGYFVISRDGIHEIRIIILTDESKFAENFRTMKETLSSITTNIQYKNTCCEVLQNKKSLDNQCKLFFENNRDQICSK